MLLSIIIVSYNTRQLTLQAINSAMADCLADDFLAHDSEIIVIDNHSKDDSVAAITTLASNSDIPIKLITNENNPGFAIANNQGLAQAKGKYLLLLNSDTIVEQGALSAMVDTFEQLPPSNLTADLSSYAGKLDRLGILAASLINPDGSPQHQGGSFPTLWSLFCHMSFLDDLPIIGHFLPSTQHTGWQAEARRVTSSDPVVKELLQKDWVGGTALMIKRDTLEEIGPLDEQIFMYGEDVEWCMRAKQHHWDVAQHLRAKITHFGNASGSSARAIIGELTGYLYIWSKHKPAWEYELAKLIIQFGCGLRILLFGTMMGNATKADIYRQALAQIKSL